VRREVVGGEGVGWKIVRREVVEGVGWKIVRRRWCGRRGCEGRLHNRLSYKAIGDRIISCIGELSKPYEGSFIHVHPPGLASCALFHLSSHERSQCRGLLCEYRLVDHNWKLVGTDNELERARNEYPTRRRLVPIP
jgi:hypothetical protein